MEVGRLCGGQIGHKKVFISQNAHRADVVGIVDQSTDRARAQEGHFAWLQLEDSATPFNLYQAPQTDNNTEEIRGFDIARNQEIELSFLVILLTVEIITQDELLAQPRDRHGCLFDGLEDVVRLYFLALLHR